MLQEECNRRIASYHNDFVARNIVSEDLLVRNLIRGAVAYLRFEQRTIRTAPKSTFVNTLRCMRPLSID